MPNSPTAKWIVSHPCFSVGCLLVLLLVMPTVGGGTVIAACAVVLSLYVWAQPDSFRSRNGSLTVASGLILAMWFLALLIALGERFGMFRF